MSGMMCTLHLLSMAMLNHCHLLSTGASSVLVALLLMTCWLIWRPCRLVAACEAYACLGCIALNGSTMQSSVIGSSTCDCETKVLSRHNMFSTAGILLLWISMTFFVGQAGLMGVGLAAIAMAMWCSFQRHLLLTGSDSSASWYVCPCDCASKNVSGLLTADITLLIMEMVLLVWLLSCGVSSSRWACSSVLAILRLVLCCSFVSVGQSESEGTTEHMKQNSQLLPSS